jgi:hypothetical protein
MNNNKLSIFFSSRPFILFLFIAGFLALAFLSAFQLFVPQNIPHTPNEDLARHVALALNFRDSIISGQFIPRLQLGGKDIIPDIPVFQYYGFLSSLFAQPGLFFELSPLHALVVGVVIIRWIAAIVIYAACRIHNLSQQASVLAVVAWLSFPYIQSNLYGRVAVPEAFAQAVLAFIPLTWALAVRQSQRIAVSAVMLTILLLSLAHPIFLMWGVGAITSMVIGALILNRRDSAVALFVGILLGVSVSSFQWLPAFLSSHDVSSAFFYYSPFSKAFLTSPSGFVGWPKVLMIDGGGEYYFSLSVWVMPAIVGAIVYLYKNDKARVDVLVYIMLLLSFTFLAYSPVDFWQFFPKNTWATQFPYRLLSFVAIFGAIILAYACDAIGVGGRWAKMTIMALMVLFFSGPSLIAPNIIRADGFSINEDIKSHFASQDYVATNNSKILYGDGWLQRDNFVFVPATQSDANLYIEARSGIPSNVGIGLRIINAVTKENILDRKWYVPASGTKIQLVLPRGISTISLIPDTFFKPTDIDPTSTDGRELSLMISVLYIAPNGTSLLLPSEIDRKVISPYKRSFSFSHEQKLTQVNKYIAELPLAYSRFQEISQGVNLLKSEPSHDGLTRVQIANLNEPVISYYKMPPLSIYLTAGGVLVFAIYLWLIQGRVRRAYA